MKKLANLFLAAFVAVALFAQPSEAAFSNSLLVKLAGQSSTLPRVFVYKQSTALATLIAANYFAATPQRLAAGDILIIEGSDGNGTFTVVSASTTANVLKRFGGHDELQASVTWDPGAIAIGAGETKAVTVTGAALGDFCDAACAVDLVDFQLGCSVQATDTVEMRLDNNASNADIGSTTCKVRISKP